MSKRKNDLFDSIDEIFNSVNAKENAKAFNETVNSVGKEIKSSINESLKQNGYDNINEYIRANFTSSAKQTKRPSERKVYQTRRSFENRYDYFMDALMSVRYDLKYRGYFKEGHQEAIHTYLLLAEKYKSNLDALNIRLKNEIRDLKITMRKQKKDAWNEGYLNGLEYIAKSIKNSKVYMMGKIAMELSQ